MQKIYVLRCENDKYYIGKTWNIDRRFAEHLSGTNGSNWTSLHRPLDMIEVKDMASDFDEMNTTLEYMKTYGIDNVRGAQWSNTHLTQDQQAAIMAALNINACFHCGIYGHFVDNCPNRDRSSRTQQTMRCFRCGRDSHFERDCYATFDINRNRLECARCGRGSHDINRCYAEYHVDGRRL